MQSEDGDDGKKIARKRKKGDSKKRAKGNKNIREKRKNETARGGGERGTKS